MKMRIEDNRAAGTVLANRTNQSLTLGIDLSTEFQTLVLYRTRPIPRRQVGSGRRAGRVRYSCLKEAACGEALMQIEWCWGDEKGVGRRERN
jgi:hypothetical protein